MTKQPAAAPPAAISQVATRCFHRGHDGTEVSRQNATSRTIAEMKPTREGMAIVITSGVPRIGARITAITAAGTTAFFIADFISLFCSAFCSPTLAVCGAGPRAQDCKQTRLIGVHSTALRHHFCASFSTHKTKSLSNPVVSGAPVRIHITFVLTLTRVPRAIAPLIISPPGFVVAK